MNSRTLKALEFGKVLEHLASFCVSEAGRAACLALLPLSGLRQVEEAQELFDQVRTWARTWTRATEPGKPAVRGNIHTDTWSATPAQSSRRAAQKNEGTTFHMAFFPDLQGLFAHLAKGTGDFDADAFWALRDVMNLASGAVRSIASGAGQWPALHRLAESRPMPEMSLAALNRCISDDGLLRDESSPELLLVRGELRRLHQGCLRKVKEFAVQYNIAQYLQDEYMTLASDRYVLPLKSNFKGRVQGIIHDYSNTGETCYFEPLFLVEQNNRLQELKHEEREEERKVLRMLTGLAESELPLLQAAWNLLVRLDVELAKCTLADVLNAVCATVSDGHQDRQSRESGREALSLLAARHPLLVLDPSIRAKGGPEPVDLAFRPEDRALVISGGNAGGKTVCLKTLGLLVVMTLAGLPVPAARGSVVPWWPEIHAFIGDEQSLDDHLSTYTAQIRHLAEAWGQMNESSLVLLDEFGAGTDPAQGAALAQAVIDGLLERGASVAAATHFPALKTYALTKEGVRAASVLFDPASRKPLFRLAYDQVGASRALDVAREHGLPDAVLRRAEQYLLLDGEDSSAVLDRLNALAAQREGELDALALEAERLREKRKALQERLDRERTRLDGEVRDASKRIIKDWEAGRIAHKQALKELAKVRADLRASALAAAGSASAGEGDGASAVLDLATLKVGQTLLHRPWNKEALVREVDERQKRVKLDLNGVTLWADASLLAPASAKKPSTAKGGTSVRTSSGEISLLRLDLRGKRADLALSEVSQYLDRALLAGRDGVEIVHGRGTGALRREVHAFLRGYPGIASFALAPEDQGGDGVTVVTFR